MSAPDAPPAQRRRRRHGRVLVASLVWLALIAVPLVRTHEDHDESVAELRSAQAAEATTTSARDEQLAQLTDLTQQVEHLTRVLDILESGTTRTSSERAAAESSLTELAPAVEQATQQLDQTSALAEQQVLASINLHSCSQGTTDALTILVSGDRRGSLDRLRTVIDACRYAQLAMTEGGDIQFPWDFADPSVLAADGTNYAFATNSIGGHIQVIRSTIYGTWTWVGEALPTLPDWAQPGQTWAPSAIQVGDHFALYFSALVRGSKQKCIGVAFSSKPEGPYGFSPPDPLVCQHDESGSIDPSPFLNTDGHLYLTWKSEGDYPHGSPGKLWSAPLNDDGASMSFFPTELLVADRRDEANTIEGPNMVRVDDRWILIYSANRWDSPDYRMDYATCDSASGPCQKPPDNTILASYDEVKGPGGGELFRTEDGSLELAYHAWLDADIGFPNSRYLHLGRFRIENGRPVIDH